MNPPNDECRNCGSIPLFADTFWTDGFCPRCTKDTTDEWHVDDEGRFRIAPGPKRDLEQRINAACDMIVNFSQNDGAHHKAWVIDQAMRAITGEHYDAFIAWYSNGEDGPDTYGWDVGITP